MRRVLFAVAAFLALSLPAFAGDQAVPNFLGFSPSGHYAAFEEYGTQDGSGFAYATITIVNTRTDAWVGRRFEVLLREEGSTALSRARMAAHGAAASELARLEIAPRGQRVAWTGRGEMAGTLGFWQPRLGTLELRVADVALPDACPHDDRPLAGYRLSLHEAGEARPLDIWHEDATVPGSRKCPWSYGLAEVHVLPRETLGPVVVAVLAYDRLGFEGPDRRHLLVARTYDEAPH